MNDEDMRFMSTQFRSMAKEIVVKWCGVALVLVILEILVF